MIRNFRAAVVALVASLVLVPPALAQWPTVCVELNDIVEGQLDFVWNVGVYQRVFGDEAESACRRGHRNDIRQTFAWALHDPMPPTDAESPASDSDGPSADGDQPRSDEELPSADVDPPATDEAPSVMDQNPPALAWPTTCLELNDLVERHLGKGHNVGIYQRVLGEDAEATCRDDHRNDVREVFAWAFDIQTLSVSGPPLPVDQLVQQTQAAVRYLRTPDGCGSGFVVTADGYLVTNSHVLNGERQVDVGTHEGAEERATVVADDFDLDIALLKLPTEGPHPFLAFGYSSDLVLGTDLVVLGYPLCLETLTVTRGIFSARHGDLLQTDATANPGNSGGPAMDSRGGVIGVAFAKLGGGAVRGVENANFLIDGDTVRRKVDDWITRHRAGTLPPPPVVEPIPLRPPPPPPALDPPPPPGTLIEGAGILRDSDCTSDSREAGMWLGSLPGDPLPELSCVVYIVRWWPAGWAVETQWNWPGGAVDRTEPKVRCRLGAGWCFGGFMKVRLNNPDGRSQSSGTLAVTLSVDGRYVRTDYFRVS